MGLPNPSMNFTPLDPLPASDLNDLVENIEALADGSGIDDNAVDPQKLNNPYKFSVYRNGAWTAAGTSYGKVSFDTEVFDSNNNFSGGTYTAPVNGYYFFTSSVRSNTIDGALHQTAIYKNGSVALEGPAIEGGLNTAVQGAGVTGLLQLTAGDTVDIYHYAAASTGGVGPSITYFHGFLFSMV